MNKLSIDINCDLGEGLPNDAAIIPYISSANISCGYHAGNIDIIKNTMTLCKRYGVQVGAHPSFNDPANFGRLEMHLDAADLSALITEQLQLFSALAIETGVSVHHVKPHGALYNMAAKNRQMAAVIAGAVKRLNKDFILYGLTGSCLLEEAHRMGLQTASEAFADRTYQPDGSLTSRAYPNAMLEDDLHVVQRVLQIVQQRSVTAVGGVVIPMEADTICIHGDGLHASLFASKIYDALATAGISISAM